MHSRHQKMRTSIRGLLLVCLSLALSRCASLQQDYIERTCNKEGGYQKGYNDARSNDDMNNSFATQCPVETQAVVREAYREGYTSARSSQPTQININTGSAPIEGPGSPGWMCKESFGKKACGYDCKEAYGQVKCGLHPTSTCLEAYGKIRCGRNCNEEFGEIKCEQPD